MERVTARNPMSLATLRTLASSGFGDMVKGVVDLNCGVMLVDAEMHADLEAEFLAEGSHRQNLWGINLYPDVAGEDWIEFDSVINLRPAQGNRSRGVDDPGLRERLTALVESLVQR